MVSDAFGCGADRVSKISVAAKSDAQRSAAYRDTKMIAIRAAPRASHLFALGKLSQTCSETEPRVTRLDHSSDDSDTYLHLKTHHALTHNPSPGNRRPGRRRHHPRVGRQGRPQLQSQCHPRQRRRRDRVPLLAAQSQRRGRRLHQRLSPSRIQRLLLGLLPNSSQHHQRTSSCHPPPPPPQPILRANTP